mgnify:CR=1 FL=1
MGSLAHRMDLEEEEEEEEECLAWFRLQLLSSGLWSGLWSGPWWECSVRRESVPSHGDHHLLQHYCRYYLSLLVEQRWVW